MHTIINFTIQCRNISIIAGHLIHMMHVNSIRLLIINVNDLAIMLSIFRGVLDQY